METVSDQFVDPLVTRAKYDNEINKFFDQYDQWRKKGVILLKEDFPVCDFLFLAPQLFPMSCVFAVRIDFTNFDAEPPSVQFINPYTGQSMKAGEISVRFRQKASAEFIAEKKPSDISEGMDIYVSMKGKPPFICHPGFKEYHEHPRHTGDSWLIRRSNGEGRLYRLLQVLHSHSIALVESFECRTIGSQTLISIKQRKP